MWRIVGVGGFPVHISFTEHQQGWLPGVSERYEVGPTEGLGANMVVNLGGNMRRDRE
jgi:hypothetical protein